MAPGCKRSEAEDNLYAEWDPANYEQAERLVMSYTDELSFRKGRRWSVGKANYIVGGWKTSGIATFASGRPFSVFCCASGFDQFGDNYQQRLRPNITAIPCRASRRVSTSGSTSACLRLPFRALMADWDEIRQRQADLSFVNDTHIKEAGVLELRMELSNFLSSWHIGNVFPASRMNQSPAGCTGPSGNCQFGSLVPLNGLGALNLWTPHVIQLAAKFTF